MSDTVRMRALGNRARNILARAGATTDDEAAQLTDQQILSVRNAGSVSLAEIRAVFPDPDPPIEEVLQARVARLQRLWQTWSAAQGYAYTSRRWTAFAEALKACEANGDLLPEEAEARS